MVNKNKAPKRDPIYKRPLFWAIAGTAVILSAIFIGMILNSTSNNKTQTKKDGRYELNIIAGEASTVARVRVVISQNALDGTGKMFTDECVTLGRIARSLNSSAEYFDKCSGVLYSNTADTNQSDIITLSDGIYCATFIFDKNLEFLKEYSFEQKTCKGYSTPLYDR